MRYAYDTLKMNCKRRKKIFKLTFEQFKFYAQATDYIAGKGRKSLSYSIDCRDPALGYTESNIRPMHKGDNSAKGKKRLVYDWETWHATVEKVGAIRNIDDPF